MLLRLTGFTISRTITNHGLVIQTGIEVCEEVSRIVWGGSNGDSAETLQSPLLAGQFVWEGMAKYGGEGN